MDGNTFKQKIAEGFVVGMMVSLTLAVAGVVWKGFDRATSRLESTESLLLEQRAFNTKLLETLGQEQKATSAELQELARDLAGIRLGLEGKLNVVAARIDELHTEAPGDPQPSLGKEFGKLTQPLRVDPNRVLQPNYKGLGTDFRNIVQQRAPIQ